MKDQTLTGAAGHQQKDIILQHRRQDSEFFFLYVKGDRGLNTYDQHAHHKNNINIYINK